MGHRCFIFAALPTDYYPLHPEEGDLVIAADKGLERARALGVEPDLLIGDFDSTGYVPDFPEKITLQVRKDDTDTAHAMEVAYAKGYREFIIYGALGGKLDHTFATIQQSAGYEAQGASVLMIGNDHIAKVITSSETITFPASYKGRISIFSLSDQSEGVTIAGLDYGLESGTLTRMIPLGVSNEFIGKVGTVHVEKGQLLIIYDTQETLII